jgi:Rrf2 family protein
VLSNKSKYGLKALLVLAEEAGRGPVLVSELARRDAIPKKFLEAILLELNRHGLVQSKKGKGGGYFLRRTPDQITFGEVIRVLEGPLAAVPCVSQMAYSRCAECLDEDTCGVRLAMKEVRDATARILDGTTLADINARVAGKPGKSRHAGRSREPGAARRDRKREPPRDRKRDPRRDLKREQ